MSNQVTFSRRQFLERAGLAAAALALTGDTAWGAEGASLSPPLALFSKVYQELKLDFDQASALTAEAGLDGLDVPVRPGGEVLPERAAQDLPRYAEALRQRNRRVLLLTTAILSPSTPHAETVLRAAKQVGVRFYRLGPVQLPREADAAKPVAEMKAKPKDLAALNRELGLTAVFQNHSPGGKNRYLGGDLGELEAVVRGFNPDEVGVAFDLGHALNVHGRDWPAHFARLQDHIRVAYVKDFQPGKGFVRFGQGEFSGTDWFSRLRKINCRAPMSIHIEFDWPGPNQAKTRPALLQALQESVAVVRQWLAKA